MTDATQRHPVVHVIGLGPSGPDLVTKGALDLINSVETQFLRTERHPAAVVMPDAQWFDRLYETSETTEQVYLAIVEALVRAAQTDLEVLYAVPGSPVVAEHSVQLLLADDRVTVRVHPAMSFLDLSWARLGVDPVAVGARLVDGHRFGEVVQEWAGRALDEGGRPPSRSASSQAIAPMLVAQCDNRFVLSDIKLSAADPIAETVTVLHHLGLEDERVFEVDWAELDRSFEPDHLTSLWIDSVRPAVRSPRFRQRMRIVSRGR